MRKGSRIPAGLLCVVTLTIMGCKPRLGDACEVNTDCSVQGDRECDTSAPGGYCTVEDCVEGACGDEGYCVRFEPDQLRLSTSWCMAKCRRGCRDLYRCVSTEDLNASRCGFDIEEFRRLQTKVDDETQELTGEEREEWTQLQLCLERMPRAAEMLDDSPDARFCSEAPAAQPSDTPAVREDEDAGDGEE